MKTIRVQSALGTFVALVLSACLGAANVNPAISRASESIESRPNMGLEPLTFVTDAGGVSISWRGTTSFNQDGEVIINDGSIWANTPSGSASPPTRFVSLEFRLGQKVDVEIAEVESSGVIEPSGLVSFSRPRGFGGSSARLSPASVYDGKLPSKPVYVSHEGFMRGRRIVVLAVSPVYATPQGVRIATQIRARVPGAAVIDLAGAGSFSSDAAIQALGTKAPGGLDHPYVGYAINSLANQSALRILVTTPGLQRVPATAFTAIGLSPITVKPTFPRLFFMGNEVPLAWRDVGKNIGEMDDGDELMFYAPVVGDRYNRASVYWLWIDPSGVGSRIVSSDARPSYNWLPTSTQVRERATWRIPLLYQSLLPGPDGDHWWNKLLTVGYGSSDPALTVTRQTAMPALAGSSVLTVSVYGKTGFPHFLQAVVGGLAITSTWAGAGNSERVFSMSTGSGSVTLNMLPTGLPDSMLVESLQWERPVRPDVSGGGGDFYTEPNTELIYSLTGYDPSWPIFDVTDPLRPQLLLTSAHRFQAGPQQRHIIAGGPNSVSTPTIEANTPVDLSAPRSADIIYVVPESLRATLNPLISLRQSQGYQTQIVDLAAIYATFGYGMVSPAAIRDYFRHAVGTWTRKPIAAVLVGDGTMDPFNYLGKSYAFANNVPPYLLMVDPYAGETSCETCYGQLDGADPLSDAIPDIWVGRLAANTAAELATLVNKMVRYESSTTIGSWNRTLGWLADNYREANGSSDPGGDFAGYQERLANFPWDSPAGLAPTGTTKACVYYNPYLPTAGTNPCYESNATMAHAKTMGLINNGAAIVTYNGHGNYIQLAGTDPGANYPNNALLNYFDPFYENSSTDPYGNPVLANGTKLPIMLEMTPLTSGFQTPGQYYPQTIDERLVLAPNGGALAVWGSSGSGVSHGHAYLANGFFSQLRANLPGQVRLGELIQAGYLSLFQSAYACCGDSIRTYLLLGDPLTKPRVSFDWTGTNQKYAPRSYRQ